MFVCFTIGSMPKCLCFVSAVLILALRLVPCVIALSPWNVTSSEFVRILWTSSTSSTLKMHAKPVLKTHLGIVVDNWLYIDGGEYYLRGASSYTDLILGELSE